jgi:hypothetical protein
MLSSFLLPRVRPGVWVDTPARPYDTVPEVVILDALFRSQPSQFVPIFFDEAGHRVGTQYLMSALEGSLPQNN